jgi:hypothetical protein
MSKLLLTFGMLSMLLFSCSKEEHNTTGTGKLELVFRARFNGRPLVYGKINNYFNGGDIIFTKTDLLMSKIRLMKASDSILIKDVEFVSLMEHHTTTTLAEDGLKIVYDQIPEGIYTGINFNIGLTPEQNKTVPADYTSTHILSDGTKYWPAWNSYIFSKVEGTFRDSMDHGFSYHSGFDISMRTENYPGYIQITKGDTTPVDIEIDYEKLFNDNGVPMDIAANSQIHNMSFVMLRFMDRYKSAISLYF